MMKKLPQRPQPVEGILVQPHDEIEQIANRPRGHRVRPGGRGTTGRTRDRRATPAATTDRTWTRRAHAVEEPRPPRRRCAARSRPRRSSRHTPGRTPPLGFSHGSFSTFHINASASVIRRSNRCSRGGRSSGTVVLAPRTRHRAPAPTDRWSTLWVGHDGDRHGNSPPAARVLIMLARSTAASTERAHPATLVPRSRRASSDRFSFLPARGAHLSRGATVTRSSTRRRRRRRCVCSSVLSRATPLW